MVLLQRIKRNCARGAHSEMRCQQQLSLGSPPTDLDQRFTGREQRLNVRPRIPQNLAKKRVTRVATREPNDLWRRTEPRDQIDKVAVFREHDGTVIARAGEYVGIFGAPQAKFAHRYRVDSKFLAKPPGEPGGQLRIYPDAHRLRREDRVSQATTGKAKTRRDVFALQVGEFFNDLVCREAYRQQVEHITHANPHPADTGTAPALIRVHGDAIHQLNGLSHRRRSGWRTHERY